MGAENKAFQPSFTHASNAGQPAGEVLSVSVTASTTAAATTQFFSQDPCIRVANKTSAWAHVSFGVFGFVPVATLNYPAVAPGSVEIFTVQGGTTGASVILDAAPSGSAIVMFTKGNGV